MKRGMFSAAMAASFTVAAMTVFAAGTAQAQPEEAIVPIPAPAAAAVVTVGKMVYGNDGYRIAAVNRVTPNGDAQIILNGRLVTISASTLSDVGGKLTTSLAKRDLARQ